MARWASATPKAASSVSARAFGRQRQRVMIAMAMANGPTAGRRRADDRAGRHRSGAGTRSSGRSEARSGLASLLITHDLGSSPRSPTGSRDAGRRDRGARTGRRDLRPTRSIPTLECCLPPSRQGGRATGAAAAPKWCPPDDVRVTFPVRGLLAVPRPCEGRGRCHLYFAWGDPWDCR